MFDFLLRDRSALFGIALKEAAAMRGYRLYDHQGSLDEGLAFAKELRPKVLLICPHGWDDQWIQQLMADEVSSKIPTVFILESAANELDADLLLKQVLVVRKPLSPLALMDQLAQKFL